MSDTGRHVRGENWVKAKAKVRENEKMTGLGLLRLILCGPNNDTLECRSAIP
jgi:hypothetical protein